MGSMLEIELNGFHRREGELFVDDLPLSVIAKEVGTPFYCYSASVIADHYRRFTEGLAPLRALIAYAVKANSNIAVLRGLARHGAGADIVSGGELRRALTAGIPASKIVFSGVGKTAEEMAFALESGIYQFNVESAEELDILNQVAQTLGQVAPVSLRVNPDIEAGGHAKISTGRAQDKFGIAQGDIRDLVARTSALENVEFCGLAVHIGSQIQTADPFIAAFIKLRNLVCDLRADGVIVQRLDLGGGLGIGALDSSNLSIETYCQIVRDAADNLEIDITIEPGRAIVAEAGVLASKVIQVKRTEGRTFLIMDAGMNDLMRPALYEAEHVLEPVHQGQGVAVYDIVGPVCETGDTFALDHAMPVMAPGDLAVFRDCGAYGAVLSNEYNTRPTAPEVMVQGRNWSIIRERPSFEDIIARDVTPAWLNGGD